MSNMQLPWAAGTGEHSDIVIATRVRLARNLAGRKMPHLLDAEQGGIILNQCKGLLTGMEPEAFDFFRMEELSNIERGVMVEEHLISPAFMQPSPYAAAAVSHDRRMCIMINEEDHLRIQCLLPGLCLHEAWRMASVMDDSLGRKLEYAFDPQLGFITACPTNLGTGLRASVMLHLPALKITGRLKSIFANLSRMGITVRGIYGEGSEFSGNLYQISNQITLGLSEAEIIENLYNVVLQIIDAEQEARNILKQQDNLELTDNVWRAYGLLANARKMNIDEMMARLSYLRLGIDMGIIEGINTGKVNELMIKGQTAYIYKSAGKELNAQEENKARADILREGLGNLE